MKKITRLGNLTSFVFSQGSRFPSSDSETGDVRFEWAWGALWLVVGLITRLWAFGWFRFREDEALYAYWARLISSGRDVMLEWVPVDKPPLFIYTLAQWFKWFGVTEAAGRSLSVLASMLSLLLLWLLARRLADARTALWTLALFALSPYAISYAHTLYIDPTLTMWLVLALLFASYRLGLLAGLTLGLAFATKQNGLLFIPLVVPALLLGRYPLWLQKYLPRFMRCWLLPLITASAGFGYVWFKVWQWDGWRIHPPEIANFWEQSWQSYGGLSIAPLAAWPARLTSWWQVWRWWGGWLPGTALLVGLTIIAVCFAAIQGRRTHHFSVKDLWILLFAAYILGYLLLHLVWSFQPWDRYLLPLAPLGTFLAARGIILLLDAAPARSFWRWGMVVVLVAVLAVGAGKAAAARIPIGGDHGAYSGVDSVADYLRTHVPRAHGVVYQRWLGWHWLWYLWDGPSPVYWADPAMLVADLSSDPYGYARFVVFPGWELDKKEPLEASLAPLGLHLSERLRVIQSGTDHTQFVVYEIEPHAPIVMPWPECNLLPGSP